MEAFVPVYGDVVRAVRAVPAVQAVRSATPPPILIRKPSEPSPAPILPRVAAGEEAAFAECLARYRRLVYSVVRRACHSSSDVDDACQDIFMALWRSAGAFDPERSSEATFVVMVARRRLVDRQRAVATRAIPVVPEEPPISSSAMENYVDARVAVTALGSCNQEQQHVITLAALRGFTHEQIARELSMPLGTVKSHYARGIERVKRALLGREGDS